MKNHLVLLILSLSLCSCQDKNDKQENIVLENELAYTSFGEIFEPTKVLNSEQMLKAYNGLKPGDTLDVRFKSRINSVCKKKGCWMILDLPEGEEVRISFKDYGFFVPKETGHKNVIVEGKAFFNTISVEDQKHLAHDDGKSQTEIVAITSPKLVKAFVAKGVLLEE